MSTKVGVIVQAGQTNNMERFRFLNDFPGVEVRFLEECVIGNADGPQRNRQMESLGPDSFEFTPEYIAALAESNIIVTAMSPVPSAAFQEGNVKAVCILRSGVENVNVEQANAAGVKVINTPGRLSVPVAEYTVGMVISEMKNIARGYSNLSEGRWINRYPNRDYNSNIRGSKVGIVGLGAVGSRVAKIFSAFEANILVYDPYVPAENVKARGYTPMTLNELCEQADVICMHFRLTDETAGLIGKEQFERMKPHVCIVNTARAELIDQDALVEALRNHRIGGAALDVFPTEPIDSSSPLVGLDNATVTPHLAGYCANSFDLVFDIMADALKSYFETGTWKNTVN